MNGWAAAIMRMWLLVERQRLPRRPHGLAQSNTGRCWSFRVRRALDGHGAAAEQVRRLVLRPAEADLGQEVELEIGEPRLAHAEHVAAEVVAERVGVERVADVERARQRALEALQHLGREALRGERLVVDLGRADQRAAADRVAHDVVDLLGRVAERGERPRHHAVDDLEVAAARELLELDQREVRLDAGGVAVHDQADRAGRRDHRGLGVAIAVGLAPLERLIPGRARASTSSGSGARSASSGTGRTARPS